MGERVGEGGGVDVEALFRKFTITEIQDIEKTVKGDMERKKEDLRNMVGRRYRDIIQAADSIRQMQTQSQHILGSVKEVSSGLERLSQLQLKLSYAQQRANLISSSEAPVDAGFSSNCQLKLMLDIPEMVWECLDAGGPLGHAVWLLLLMDSIYHRLRLGLKPEDGERLKAFELQWLKMRALRARLLQETQAAVVSVEGSAASDAESLAALALLQELTPVQALKHFLALRKEALVKALGESELSGRERVCGALGGLQATLLSVADLFTGPLFLSHLHKLLAPGSTPEPLAAYLGEQRKRFRRSLPSDVLDFHPTLSTKLKEVEITEVQAIMQEWIQECIAVCKDTSKTLMPFFESLESLAALKKTLRQTLSASLYGDEWKWACEKVLGAELSLWHAILKDLLESRIKELGASRIREALGALGRAGREEGESGSLGLWLSRELPTDTPLGTGLNTLALKARALTPPVHRLMREVESEVGGIRESLAVCMEEEGEASALWHHLCLTTAEALARLIQDLTDVTVMETKDNYLAQCVWRWQMLCGLCELAPGLRELLSFVQADAEQGKRLTTDPPEWAKAKAQLCAAAVKVLQPWVSAAATKAVTESRYQELTHTEDRDALWLANAMDWEWVEIGEEGSTERIAVPAHPSRHSHALLQSLARAAADIGAHRIHRETLTGLLDQSLALLLPILHSLAASPLQQAQALQLIFDIRLLSTFLAPVSKDHQERISGLIKTLESKVDPFDLDLISPHLKRNIPLAASRHVGLKMPKKFVGINSKAAEAKARKAAQEAEKKDAKQKAEEDAFWQDDDKIVNRKLGRKADAERKKEEAAAKKAERDALYATELEKMGVSSTSAEKATKVTQAHIDAERDRREELKRLEDEERKREQEKLTTFEVEENVNRLRLDEESARGVDQALAVLGSGTEEVDRHPEKRMKNAWKAFEETNMPVVRRDNPGLKMSQYRQMLRKEWERSPDNPLNRQ